ncbi:MAG: V-type ATP synthase subunit F [Candidatus Diapherotrites archaeon]|nr:V-type ATP synthase subunit F [Candidatus Diapherotrites archaeon]
MVEEKDFAHKISVIADHATCTGFRLAGIQNVYKLEGREAEQKLEELMDSQDSGIIIVNEKFFAEVSHKLRQRIDRTAKPVILAVPDKTGPSEEAESLRYLVKRALGFELMK